MQRKFTFIKTPAVNANKFLDSIPDVIIVFYGIQILFIPWGFPMTWVGEMTEQVKILMTSLRTQSPSLSPTW